ncbi:MAG: pseudouridine synthase [Acidobacteriota bacterium]
MQERLQKIVAAAGIASRRRAEQLILDGSVTVNGKTVTQLGTKADPRQDHIKVDGKLIHPEPLEYYLVNKPPGVVSSVSDPLDRPLITGLVKSRGRLYPAGRLDFQSEGLMILTNDGSLTGKITRSGEIEKRYRVKVRGEPSEEKLSRIRNGLTIDGESFTRCKITGLKRSRNCWYEVVLRQGRNRQIRRVFEHIGHPVMRIKRIAIGPILLGDLPPGGSRKMLNKELKALRGDQKRAPKRTKKR